MLHVELWTGADGVKCQPQGSIQTASMPRPRPSRTPSAPLPSVPAETFRRDVAIIVVVALGVRLVHVVQLSTSPFFDLLMGDARGYDGWALRIAAGDWVGTDVFYQAPLYPYFLAVLYRVFGHDLLVVRLAQALLGALSAGALGVAGWRFFSARVGLLAGLAWALYPTAIFFDGLIQKSTLDGFFTCVMLALIGTIITTAQARWTWLVLGVTMGLLSLTRENALLLAMVIAAWSVMRGEDLGRTDRLSQGAGESRTSASNTTATTRPRRSASHGPAVLMFAAGVAMVLLPVVTRNYAVGGGFYLTTSQFGPNLFIGNNPAADGTYMSLRVGRGTPEFERQDATELAEQAEGRPLSPAEVSSYWTGRALTFITAEPAQWLALMARKAALLINRSEMLDTESQESHAEWSAPLALLGWLGHFGLLVPLALLGALATWPRRAKLWVLYALTLSYAASVVLFFVFARYRYPLAPFLILFAAAGLVAAPHYVRALAPARRYGTLALVAVTAIGVNQPMLSVATMKTITETNLGLALQDRGAVAAAVAHYRRALQFDPGYAPAHSNLGTALRAQGRPDEAIAHYEQALTTTARTAEILLNLGNARISAGNPSGAIEAFREATTADPSLAEARTSLARALYDLGSSHLERSAFAEAEARLRESIAIDDTAADAHNNLGIALASQGRFSAAIGAFRRALDLRPAFVDAERNLAMAQRAAKP